MKRLITSSTLFLMTLSIHSWAATWEVGKAFPALTLPTIDGKDSPQVASYRGDKVMLHVFASW